MVHQRQMLLSILTIRQLRLTRPEYANRVFEPYCHTILWNSNDALHLEKEHGMTASARSLPEHSQTCTSEFPVVQARTKCHLPRSCQQLPLLPPSYPEKTATFSYPFRQSRLLATSTHFFDLHSLNITDSAPPLLQICSLRADSPSLPPRASTTLTRST